jgi:hypothetical protein
VKDMWREGVGVEGGVECCFCVHCGYWRVCVRVEVAC